MEFKKFSVDGWIFPDSLDPDFMGLEDSKSYSEFILKEKSEKRDKVLDFFEFLALCHKVVVEKDSNGNLKY